MVIYPGIILLFNINFFRSPTFFGFDRKLRIVVSCSVKDCVGILMGNALNLKMIVVRCPSSPC